MIKLNYKITFLAVLLLMSLQLKAEDNDLSQAIQKQVNSANDCVTMAYSITLKHMDADEVFKDCIERRAILIAMQKKYGPGKYGEIDIFDKIEGYGYLVHSKNKLVEKEASSYATAAGSE